jgi:hypothetical protein
MKLKSFGCSFIFGDELADVKPREPSKLTWPSLLAKDLGYEYECYARSGAGNLEILDNLLSQLDGDDSFYIINWSFPSRFSYRWETWWQTLIPGKDTPETKFYFQHFNDNYVDKLKLLTCMSTAVTALKSINARYIMTVMYLDHIQPTTWETSLNTVYNNVVPYVTFWEGVGFNEWCDNNDVERHPNKHPTESVHIKAFEYMKSQLIQKGL